MCGPNESSPKPVARRARSFVLKRQPAAGLHQPDALDAYHFRGFGPFAPAHEHFGMVDAERLDLADDMASLGLRVGLCSPWTPSATRGKLEFG